MVPTSSLDPDEPKARECEPVLSLISLGLRLAVNPTENNAKDA